MIGLSDIKRAILVALRSESAGLDHFMLAAAIGEAPFRVRGELQDLRRERLVHSTIRRDRIVWELTSRGERMSWGTQLELGA